MKSTLLSWFLLLSATSSSLSFEPSVYDEAYLRVVSSFDLASPAERKGIESWAWINQDIFERTLGEPEAETFLRKAYFNGTSEAKAYALTGLHIKKSRFYAILKKDFLRLGAELVVHCHATGLKSTETPLAIVAAIESESLPSRVHPHAKGEAD